MTTDARPGAPTGTGPAQASQGAVWAALLTVYVVWGSTYLAIALVVQTMPPQLTMAMRFLTAALVMAGAIAVTKGPSALRVTRRGLASSALVGALLLGVGMGNVTMAEKYVPSGVVALLVAVAPLWAVMLRAVTGDRPARLTWIGVGVGLLGTAVLVLPGSSDAVGGASPLTRTVWSLLVMAGSMCWALGSFLAPRLPVPSNPFVLTTYEMLAGAAVLVVRGLASGERITGDEISQVSTASWWGFAYLVLIGSLVAFTAYVWVLDHAPLSLVMTYAYVNPVVAVALGALVLGERVTAGVLLGGAVIVVGVLLVVQSERRRSVVPAAAD